MTHFEYLQSEIFRLENDLNRVRAERDALTLKVKYYCQRYGPPPKKTVIEALAPAPSKLVMSVMPLQDLTLPVGKRLVGLHG